MTIVRIAAICSDLDTISLRNSYRCISEEKNRYVYFWYGEYYRDNKMRCMVRNVYPKSISENYSHFVEVMRPYFKRYSWFKKPVKIPALTFNNLSKLNQKVRERWLQKCQLLAVKAGYGEGEANAYKYIQSLSFQEREQIDLWAW